MRAYTDIRFVGYVAAWTAALMACRTAGGAGFFTEISTDADATAGRYVEFVPVDEAATMEVALINAVPQQARTLLARFTVTVDELTRMAVLLEGEVGQPAGTSAVAVDDLPLNSSFGGSRSVVLFGGPTGWAENVRVPDPAAWADDPAVPDVLDVVTLGVGWPAAPLFDEDVLELALGQAVGRSHDAHQALGPWHVLDPSGPYQNPGRFNLPITPEPGTAAMSLVLVCGAVLAGTRRRRAGHPAATPVRPPSM